MDDELEEVIVTETSEESRPSRPSAARTTEWTREEFELMARWERMADLKKRAHHQATRKFQKRSEILTTTISVIGSIIGSSGITSFFNNGAEDPALLVVGIVTLLGGIAAAVAGGFKWDEKQSWNAISTTDFADIARDVRTFGSMADLSRRDVELYLMGLKSSIKTAESREPWVPFDGMDDEGQLLQSPTVHRKRKKRQPITHPCKSCLDIKSPRPTLPPPAEEDEEEGSPTPS